MSSIQLAPYQATVLVAVFNTDHVLNTGVCMCVCVCVCVCTVCTLCVFSVFMCVCICICVEGLCGQISLLSHLDTNLGTVNTCFRWGCGKVVFSAK